MDKDFLLNLFSCKDSKKLNKFVYSAYINGIQSPVKLRLTKLGYLELVKIHKLSLEVLSVDLKEYEGRFYFDTKVKVSRHGQEVIFSYCLLKTSGNFSTVERQTSITIAFKHAVSLLMGLDIIIDEDIASSTLEDVNALYASKETIDIVKNKIFDETQFETMLNEAEAYFKIEREGASSLGVDSVILN